MNETCEVLYICKHLTKFNLKPTITPWKITIKIELIQITVEVMKYREQLKLGSVNI